MKTRTTRRIYFDRNADIRDAVSRLVDGTLPGVGKDQFQDIYHSLLFGDYDRADKYFLLYDFDAYRAAFENVLAAYTDKPAWTRKAALNTASAGYFSVDRTIDEYNRIIWGLGFDLKPGKEGTMLINYRNEMLHDSSLDLFRDPVGAVTTGTPVTLRFRDTTGECEQRLSVPV